MDKNDRFTDQAFKKVTDQKVIDKAKLKAEQLSATKSSSPKDKKIS